MTATSPLVAQLWPQLLLLNDTVHCHYHPGPDSELIIVPILPYMLQQDALHQLHDIWYWTRKDFTKAALGCILGGYGQ